MIFKQALHYIPILLLLNMPYCQAEEVLVAVAANFKAPMQIIAGNFENETGHKVNLTFGSSGKIFAQIQNGAPFDVFLSADQEKPIQLEESGDTVNGSRFTYAQGQLALWSTVKDDPKDSLLKGDFRHLAIANPALAPYGRAATDVIQYLSLTDNSKGKIVMGENISQTWQFVATGNAELGFVALSQILDPSSIKSGNVWIVPSEFYGPIRQDAVLLQHGASNSAARALITYLSSSKSRQVIKSYGYHLTEQPNQGVSEPNTLEENI